MRVKAGWRYSADADGKRVEGHLVGPTVQDDLWELRLDDGEVVEVNIYALGPIEPSKRVGLGTLPGPAPCPLCRGTGKGKPGLSSRMTAPPCPACDGGIFYPSRTPDP